MKTRKPAPKGSLKEYHRKRDFAVTPEPRGEEKKKQEKEKGGRSFVVQKHAASHLHYDFRLELEGVLKSWAVPKGPSMDPADKRLAMEVEDHPIEYGGFEGIIPKGQYGGGTVMLWDRGTWEPVEDPHKGYRDGKLVFALHGEKLKGRFHLVLTKSRDRRDEKRSWLLFKEKDAEARPGWSVAEEMPLSVTTKRDLPEIASDEDRVWDSKVGEIAGRRKKAARTAARPAAKPTRAAPAKETGALAIAAGALDGARKAALPKSVEVQLPTLVDTAPDGDAWLHELKLDGYRIVARKDGAKVTLTSRNGLDWTSRMKSVAEAVAQLPARTAVLDGEVVVLAEDGRASFNALQNVFEMGEKASLTYYVFDLLHLDGQDLARVPLVGRKDVLSQLVEGGPAGIRFSDHVIGGGPRFFEVACQRDLEGIVSKQKDCPYAPGRGKTWVKVKCHKEQEAVVGGFTEPTGSREGIGALLLGLWEGDKLVYAGKVGTGFTQKVARDLRRKLDALEVPKSPFVGTVREKGSHWVRPELVAQVRFGEWTPDHRMRHPSFLGLRADKASREVVPETPQALPMKKQPSTAPGPAPKITKSPRKGEGEEDFKKGASSATMVAGVRITNGDRILYPEQGVTKRDLARYYESIADWVVPHLKDRPTTLVRCPEGLGKECFYQKHSGTWAPASLRRALIPENRKTGEYLIVDDVSGVVGLVQIGVLEIHTWNSTVTDLEKPDRLVFDLDPDEGLPFTKTVEAARLIRDGLKTLGLTAFVKTTGGKGLHVVTPLVPGASWDECGAFSHNVVTTIEQARPEDFVTNMRKVLRKGKIFLDYLRNVRGSTSIAAYSTRARPGAPVSTPISWDELDARTTGDRFTIANVPRRLASLKADPWAGYEKARVPLPR